MAPCGLEICEEPRSSTGLKLIGEEAPSTLPWRYVLTDETRRSFVGFLPSTLSRAALGNALLWPQVKTCAAPSSLKPWKVRPSSCFVPVCRGKLATTNWTQWAYSAQDRVDGLL